MRGMLTLFLSPVSSAHSSPSSKNPPRVRKQWRCEAPVTTWRGSKGDDVFFFQQVDILCVAPPPLITGRQHVCLSEHAVPGSGVWPLFMCRPAHTRRGRSGRSVVACTSNTTEIWSTETQSSKESTEQQSWPHYHSLVMTTRLLQSFCLLPRKLHCQFKCCFRRGISCLRWFFFVLSCKHACAHTPGP